MASPVFWTVDPTTALAFIVAFFGPIGAYLMSARKMSGKIANSDAEQLWSESKSIRDWSAVRIEACEKEINQLRVDLVKKSNRLAALESENRLLSERLGITTHRIEELVHLLGLREETHG